MKSATLGLMIGAGMALFDTHVLGQFTILHHFEGGPGDGRAPDGELLAIGSTAYGITEAGGKNGFGTIFALDTMGTNFHLIYEFTGSAGGEAPTGSLVSDGSNLYGVTQLGGAGDCGVIFTLTTNGTGFKLLHAFEGPPYDGQAPMAAVSLGGTVLYGTTHHGGISNMGVIFRVDARDGDYKILHHFMGGSHDGSYPEGGLTVDGSTLYGSTGGGGASDSGTIFAMKSDGSGFKLLHHFHGFDGWQPVGPLTKSGSVLYGITGFGGVYGGGAVIRLNTDASGFQVLHDFSGQFSDGAGPFGSLLVRGTKIYGATVFGNHEYFGVLYAMNTDGTGFSDVYDFMGAPDGDFPAGGLCARGSTFFGMTTYGGIHGQGTVYSIHPASLDVAASPPRGGFVSGGGTFVSGATQALVAVAHRGWRFKGWADGDTNALRSVIVPSNDVAYTANFVITGFVPAVQNDFDGDATGDIAAYVPALGNWYVIQSSSGAPRVQNWGWSQAVPVAADYDGDGRIDLATYVPSLGNWYILQSANGTMRIQNWGWSQALPVPADYDGDGRADLATYVPAEGNWYISQSGRNGALRKQNWGWHKAIPVPADYDGDGRADLATYVPSDGNWHILNSSNGKPRTQNWGWRQAMPVPADYDGDGKCDVATYVPAEGYWYISQTSLNGRLRRLNWGWQEAAPVPADYDGDGRADFATYHPPTGLWYILNSSGGMKQVQWGWSQAVPVLPQFQINRRYFPKP